MIRPLLKQYLDAMDEVKGLCNSIMLRGAYKFELSNIKRLQMEVQSINVDDLIDEIFTTTLDDRDGIKRALSVYEYRLKGKLFYVDIDEGNATDVGDNGELLKHFADEATRLQATVPDNLKSFYMCEDDATEFLVRLHDILRWCNYINNTFMKEYKKLSSWVELEPQQKSNEKTTVDLKLPSELNTKKPALITKGRKKSTFKDGILKENKEEILSCLKKVITGQKGKYVALIIRTCIREGLIKKPTFSCVENEFGGIGHRSGYNKYMDEKYEFADDEKNGATKTLEPILQ